MKRPPHHYQSTDWTCGPAVIRMALGAFGIRVAERALARRMETNPKTGTRQSELVRCLRRSGLRVEAHPRRRLDRLVAARTAGAVVIILYRDREGEEGHYALLLGAGKERVTLRDPWYGPRYALPRSEFLSRWHDTSGRSRRWALIARKDAAR